MVNKVILIGNVGGDPEIRTFEDGSKVARINLATTERIYNSTTQERSERTEWHRITLWRGLAGIAEQYVRKGSKLYIEGKIRTNDWTDANGQKRYGVEIVADSMNMLDSRRDGAPQQQYGAPQQQYGAPQQQQYGAPQQQYGAPQQQQYGAPQQQSTPAAQPTNFDNSPDDIDDLPF